MVLDRIHIVNRSWKKTLLNLVNGLAQDDSNRTSHQLHFAPITEIKIKFGPGMKLETRVWFGAAFQFELLKLTTGFQTKPT